MTMRGGSLVVAGLVLALSGCWGDSTAPGKAARSASTGAAATQQSDSQCESVLSSIDDIFQLPRLGRTTAIGDGVARMNDWLRSCGTDVEAASPPLPSEIRKLLSDEEIQLMADRRFTLRDGEHFRDCLLERAISTYAGAAGETEVDKVTHVFNHIVRALGLIPHPLQDLPLTPYEVYLLGKGTAEDRALIFVNVLRQLKIDAVLLFPRSADAGDRPAGGQPFLVGVLLDERVFLFDPRSGVPIPALGSDSAGRSRSRVATLAEATTDPALLKQLDASAERPYPIRAADLARPLVMLVGDTSLWSARMQALQTQFVGKRAMIISDLLADAAVDSQGLWSRVVKAGGEQWTADDLRVWEYPEARSTAHQHMTRDQQDTLTGLMRPFDAYKNIARDPRTGREVLVEKEWALDPARDEEHHPGVHVNVRTTVGEQMRSRLTHLGGDFTEAIKGYTDVRSRSKAALKVGSSVPDRSMHSRAIDDATYWTGLCQFEQGEFKAAANTLARYQKHAESGNWTRESRYLEALSLAASGDYAAAIGELQAVEPDDLEYFGDRYLIRQWQAAQQSP